MNVQASVHTYTGTSTNGMSLVMRAILLVLAVSDMEPDDEHVDDRPGENIYSFPKGFLVSN